MPVLHYVTHTVLGEAIDLLAAVAETEVAEVTKFCEPQAPGVATTREDIKMIGPVVPSLATEDGMPLKNHQRTAAFQ